MVSYTNEQQKSDDAGNKEQWGGYFFACLYNQEKTFFIRDTDTFLGFKGIKIYCNNIR